MTVRNCDTCYRSGGIVLASLPTVCFCPETDEVYDPLAESCPNPLSLCSSAFFCDTDCLTCQGPNPNDCLTCTDPDKEVVPIGNSPAGPCSLPCLPGQYIDYVGGCEDPDCGHLSNCSNHGSCSWDGTKSVCVCDSNFNGDDCSTPVECPLLNDCSNHGVCRLNRITDELYCDCDYQWTENDCHAPDSFLVSPSGDSELGGDFMTLYHPTGFQATGNSPLPKYTS